MVLYATQPKTLSPADPCNKVTMAVSFSDLQLAFEFVSSGGMGENEAYLDRQSGKIYWHSEFGDNDEELPDDIDDAKYISIPDSASTSRPGCRNAT